MFDILKKLAASVAQVALGVAVAISVIHVRKEVPAHTAPTVMPILEFVSKTEGTAKGRGYEETLGYGAFTGGNVTLTAKSLDDIDEIQTRMLRHPKNKWNSSAVGKYQIIRTTLRQLRKKLGLKGTELFDAEMQDRLAFQLLKWRGYDDWKAGRISDRAFQASIAKEWASWTNPYTGRGVYRGQNSGTKIRDQQAALDAERLTN